VRAVDVARALPLAHLTDADLPAMRLVAERHLTGPVVVDERDRVADCLSSAAPVLGAGHGRPGGVDAMTVSAVVGSGCGTAPAVGTLVVHVAQAAPGDLPGGHPQKPVGVSEAGRRRLVAQCDGAA
jgi:hypothetical protein